MAIITTRQHHCDRCSKVTSTSINRERVEHKHMSFEWSGYLADAPMPDVNATMCVNDVMNNRGRADLCTECFRLFEQFMRPDNKGGEL